MDRAGRDHAANLVRSAAELPDRAATTAAAQDALRLEPVVVGLELPVFVGHAGDGSERLFVVEQVGRILIVDAGELLAEPFLDISDDVLSGGERGLLGLAFHPSSPTTASSSSTTRGPRMAPA